MKLLGFLKNRIVFYLASRYIVYFIQFVTSIIVASKLGPYYLGIWGFLLLLMTIGQRCHFGISNSLNVLLVQNKNNGDRCNSYISNSMVLIFIVSFLIVSFFVICEVCNISIFDKYSTGKYLWLVCSIVVLQHINLLFINVLRIKNKIMQVTFCQSVEIFTIFICVLLLSGELLIFAMLLAYILSNIFSLFVAYKSEAFPTSPFNINKDTQALIFKKGFWLFLYSSSFYFIILTIKGLVSYFYSISQFGIFTFAYTLGNSVFLLLDAFGFIVFPKLIEKLSSDDPIEVREVLSTIRVGYISTAYLFVYLAIFLVQFLILLLPQYKESILPVNLIMLTILMNTNCYGFTTLLIAKGKEKRLASISFLALLTNLIIGLFLIVIAKIGYQYVIISTFLTYLLYSMLLSYSVGKIIDSNKRFEFLFPVRLIIPYLFAILICIYNDNTFFIVPTIVFFLFNIKEMRQVYYLIKTILIKPEVVNI